MSNASVSSQVYIIRNASALASISAGTMIVYADGTDVFAKDASGNTYNLTHPTASSLTVALNNLTDVTIASPAGNQYLQYNSGTSQWQNTTFSLALDGLSDVSASSPSTGHVLQYNGASWVTAAVSGSGITALYAATDVIDYNSGTAPNTGEALVWNATNSQFELADVVQSFTLTDGANNVQVDNSDSITLTGTAPISVTGNTGTSTFTVAFSGALTDLSDTAASFTSLAAGQTLRYSGSAFVNAALSIFDLSNVDQNSVSLSSSAGANKVLAWDQSAEKFVPVDQATSPDQPFLLKQFQLLPINKVATAGSGTMAIGNGFNPGETAYFRRVFNDSSPASDSLMAITLFPTFQAKPTLTDDSSAGSIELSFSSSQASASLVLSLVGRIRVSGSSYASSAVDITFTFSSSAVNSQSVTAANIESLLPAAIISANTLSAADFEEWELEITAKTFSGVATNSTLNVSNIALPIRQ